MRGLGNILHFLFFACVAGTTLLRAEPSRNNANNANNSNSEDDDRRRRSQEAAREGDQKTDQMLQPQKMMHDMQKMEHLRRAEEARNNKDEGTAQQEEQQAMMEQMKSQQLQQQINTNKDTAQKNRQGAEKLTEQDKDGQGKSYDPSVVTVRDGKSTQPKQSAPQEKEAPAAPPQVADLSSVPRDAFAQPPQPAPAAETAKAPEAAPPPVAKNLLGELDRMSITFDDSAKINSGEKTPQIRLLSAVGGGGGGTTTGTAASNGGSTGDTNIWEAANKAAALTAAPAPSKGERGLSSLLGSGGGEAGSSSVGALDKDFFDSCPGPEAWKKMSRGEKNGLKESCRKVAQKCDKEETEASKEGKKSSHSAKKKVKLSAQCREWKEKDKEKKDAATKGARRAQADR